MNTSISDRPSRRKSLPAEAASSRWTGYYTPSAAGTYEIFVTSTGEDGGYYRVYVDDKIVLDDWTVSKELLGIATLSFDAKPHKIVLEHHGRIQMAGRAHAHGNHTAWHIRGSWARRSLQRKRTSS